MLDDKDLEAAVQDLIMDICEIMYQRGYDMICIGHIMRLVGVANEKAQAHDQEFFALDDEFRIMLDNRKKQHPTTKKEKKAPRRSANGVTLH